MPAANSPLINTVPLVLFVIVSSFSNIIPPEPVTSRLVDAVIVVKAPVFALFAPITTPSILPPLISAVVATNASVVIEVAVVTVPKLAQVLPAAVQLFPKENELPSSADIESKLYYQH